MGLELETRRAYELAFHHYRTIEAMRNFVHTYEGNKAVKEAVRSQTHEIQRKMREWFSDDVRPKAWDSFWEGKFGELSRGFDVCSKPFHERKGLIFFTTSSIEGKYVTEEFLFEYYEDKKDLEKEWLEYPLGDNMNDIPF